MTHERRASPTGLSLVAALSLLVVAGSALLATRRARSIDVARPDRQAPVRNASGAPAAGEPVAVPPPATDPPSSPPSAGASVAAAALVDRLVTLIAHERTESDEAEIARIATGLVALGEDAAPPLVARIEALRGAAAAPRRDRLLDVLRRVPGKVAEDRLIQEARSGSADSTRSLAIEALADRRTDRAVNALSRIAETDAELPHQPLITSSRDPNDTSVELPDEVVFTPRMKAMAALASTGDARAADVLTGVLHTGPDESLRMEAARHLAGLRDTPGTLEALRAAITADPSPYVRLAALHALTGSTDRTLGPLLEGIAARDGDAGVRLLARQVLASLAP